MSLNYSFNNAKDLFDKLKRDIKLLDDEITGDRFFNMVITAYHIKDWIINSETITKDMKDDLTKLSSNKYFQICKNIANSSKHFKLNYPTNIQEVSSARGWGVGRWGKGRYGIGEESIKIKYNNNDEINVLDLIKHILDLWNTFFNTHNKSS